MKNITTGRRQSKDWPPKDSLTAPKISFFSKSPRKDKELDAGGKRKGSKENKKFSLHSKTKLTAAPVPNRTPANLKDLSVSPSEPFSFRPEMRPIRRTGRPERGGDLSGPGESGPRVAVGAAIFGR